MKCPECTYLREERAAIHEFDGKADRELAEIMAFFEKCMEHSDNNQAADEKTENETKTYD